jgi:hypothetical protein
MVTFKLMAFPMFATVVCILLLNSASKAALTARPRCWPARCWRWRWALTLRGGTRTVYSRWLLSLLAVSTWTIGANVLAAGVRHAAALRPLTWEPGRVDQLNVKGKACLWTSPRTWCVTCQYNKNHTEQHRR